MLMFSAVVVEPEVNALMEVMGKSVSFVAYAGSYLVRECGFHRKGKVGSLVVQWRPILR